MILLKQQAVEITQLLLVRILISCLTSTSVNGSELLQAKDSAFIQIIFYIFVNKSSFKSLAVKTPRIQNTNLNIASCTLDSVIWQFFIYMCMSHIFQTFWMQLLMGMGQKGVLGETVNFLILKRTVTYHRQRPKNVKKQTSVRQRQNFNYYQKTLECYFASNIKY